MDMEIVKDIIKTRANIRKKYESIKSKNIKSTAQLENIFKPITTPLKKLVKNTCSNDDGGSLMKKTKYEVKSDNDSDDDDDDYNSAIADDADREKEDDDDDVDSEEQDYETPSSTFTKIAYKHRNFQDIISQFYMANPKNIDFVYGLRKNRNGDWMIGNSDVTMTNNMLYIKEHQYVVTRGLLELLITIKPDSKLYNEEDLKNYKSILIDTNAHRNNYCENKRVRSNRGYKYTQVISPLLLREGKGIMMQVNNNPIQYSYWNDANELVDRLRLLISSQFVGNNNHTNEINSIIEELREANIII
jgi:hypothetical protein